MLTIDGGTTKEAKLYITMSCAKRTVYVPNKTARLLLVAQDCRKQLESLPASRPFPLADISERLTTPHACFQLDHSLLDAFRLTAALALTAANGSERSFFHFGTYERLVKLLYSFFSMPSKIWRYRMRADLQPDSITQFRHFPSFRELSLYCIESVQF